MGQPRLPKLYLCKQKINNNNKKMTSMKKTLLISAIAMLTGCYLSFGFFEHTIFTLGYTNAPDTAFWE